MKIFGYYNSKNTNFSFIPRMKEAFNVQNMFLEYISFSQNNVSLIYEGSKEDSVDKFYFIDKSRQIACFVIGGLHAFENSSLKTLSGKNVAKFVFDEYLKGGLDFAKYLRGAFNIVIIDNNRVFLINDTLGLSPMYIYHTENGFFFCNHADPIIWLNINNRLDYGTIGEFLVYGFVPDGKTFVRDLYNQAPGTILKISEKEMETEKYCDFKPMGVNSMSEGEKIRLVNSIFNESVQIRINENYEEVFSDLTGGWDTRFVLANLMSLNRKVIASTNSGNDEDLEISGRITKAMNIPHIRGFCVNPDLNPRIFLDLVFRRNNEMDIYSQHKDSFHDSFKHLTSRNFLMSRKFCGLFGGELLGNTPDWFDERIKLNLVISGEKILDNKFLKKVLRNKTHKELVNRFDTSLSPVYLFLNQFGRTFLNMHYTTGWERPTAFFHHQALIPFTDSKFVSLLCALEYDKYKGYRLYSMLFKKYFPAFQNYPWTYTPLRKRNDLSKVLLEQRGVKQNSNKIYRDSRFISFLKQQEYIKDVNVISRRLKELYFLFNWLDVYKSVLDSSDYHFCSGEMTGVK